MDKIIKQENNTTDLLLAIKTSFSAFNTEDKIEIILATDGQPQDKSSVLTFLSESLVNFNLVVIGAGSIQESLNSERGLCVRKNGELECYRNGEHILTSEFIAVKSSHLECDIKYLTDLIITTKGKGLYVGAYQDYKDLIDASNDYLNTVTISSIFKVQLDSSLTSLPDNVNQALSEVKSCYLKTQYGDYIYTSNFQLRVTPVKQTEETFYTGEITHSVIKNTTTYRKICDLSFEKFSQTLYLNDNELKIELMGNYIPRIRQLVKIN